MCFLALLSYYVLSELKPFVSLEDISVVEWILIIWNLSLVLEELVQVRQMFLFSSIQMEETFKKKLKMSLYNEP